MEQTEYERMYALETTHWWFVARRLFVTKLFPDIAKRKRKRIRIADIGAGTGGMMKLLGHYGGVSGLEPNSIGRRLAQKRRIHLGEGRAEHTGFPSGHFDVVCFFDVLYHKDVDDRAALKEAYRLLRPGGWLIITDCAMPFLFGPHDRAVESRERYLLGQLTKKVQSSGFVTHKKTYTFFVLFPLVAAKRMLDRFMRPQKDSHSDAGNVQPSLNAFLTKVCALESFGLSFMSYPWGSSLLLVARKKGRMRLSPANSRKAAFI